MLQNLIQTYTAYNQWANEKTIHWIQGLPAAVWQQPCASSYPDMVQTLEHMMLAQQFWLHFIREGNVIELQWQTGCMDAADVFSKLLSDSVQMEKEFSLYDAAALEQVLHLKTAWAENKRCRYEYIMHVINHNTYHRGQLISMARQTGVTAGIPNTDYNMFRTR